MLVGKMCLERRDHTLINKIRRELIVTDPVNRVGTKDLAGDQRPFEFLDEMVVPIHSLSIWELCLVRWFCSVHVTGLDHYPDRLEAIRDDCALWRFHDVEFLSSNEDTCTNAEHAETKEVCCPESKIPTKN
jgi:hypothetical protein